MAANGDFYLTKTLSHLQKQTALPERNHRNKKLRTDCLPKTVRII